MNTYISPFLAIYSPVYFAVSIFMRYFAPLLDLDKEELLRI